MYSHFVRRRWPNYFVKGAIYKFRDDVKFECDLAVASTLYVKLEFHYYWNIPDFRQVFLLIL